MSKNEKKTKKEASHGSAESLLRRLGRQDATRGKAISEKKASASDSELSFDIPYALSAMEDAKGHTDANAPLKLYAEDATEASSEFDKLSDANDITDAELQMLYDRYLGDAANSAERASYNVVHQQILDAEQRAGLETIPQTDVGKNIDEAERYIDAMTEKAEKDKGLTLGDASLAEATGGFVVDIKNTDQLNVFAPSSDTQNDSNVLHETRVLHAQETTELPLDPATDTTMMKAFGLDPKTEEIMRDRLFDEIACTDTLETAISEDSDFEEENTQAAPEQAQSMQEEVAGNAFEYVDASQNKDIFGIFRSKYQYTKVRLVLAAALVLLLGLLENIPAVGDMLGSNTNLIAVDLVLGFTAAVLVLDRLVAAAKALVTFDFDCESVTLFALVLSVIATGVALIATPEHADVYLYNFPFAICVFLNLLHSFVTLRRDVYSFKVISSPRTKTVLARTDAGRETVPERNAFAGRMEDEDRICAVKKTDFVSSFFAHRDEKEGSKFLLKIFIPECLVFSVLFFIVSFFVLDNSFSESIGTAYASFLMSAPFTAFIAYSYPLYLASRRAYLYHSAILGDKTHENYERTSVIAVRDEDAFPADKTKVKSLKLYADRKIENVMYYASSVYAKIGGPLASVFKQATLHSKVSDNVELLEVAEGGVSAMVDGKNIVIGRPDYMETQCFEVFHDAGDEGYEGKTNKRILYLACEQIVIAKFYVQYTTTSDFLYMVHHLGEIGVGVSVRTADPCIDNGVLYSNRVDSDSDVSVKVVKGILPEGKTERLSAKTGGIVSFGSVKELIKSFLICNKIANVKKINFVLKTVASILGVAVMVLVLFTGNAATMRSIFPALYQLFWFIPIYVISKIYI